MKSIILTITATIILGLNLGFAQNRFENLDPESLEFVLIKYQQEPNNFVFKKITEPEKIKKVLNLLKQTHFKKFKYSDEKPILNGYVFLIKFGGWRESTYIFKEDAFIGKTQFSIDPNVVDQLKILYKNL